MATTFKFASPWHSLICKKEKGGQTAAVAPGNLEANYAKQLPAPWKNWIGITNNAVNILN